MRLEADELLLRVPGLRRFNLDLAAAKILKKDPSGRAVDFHSLRVTLGTHLSRGGVTPRVAQAALRHSTIDWR